MTADKTLAEIVDSLSAHMLRALVILDGREPAAPGPLNPTTGTMLALARRGLATPRWEVGDNELTDIGREVAALIEPAPAAVDPGLPMPWPGILPGDSGHGPNVDPNVFGDGTLGREDYEIAVGVQVTAHLPLGVDYRQPGDDHTSVHRDGTVVEINGDEAVIEAPDGYRWRALVNHVIWPLGDPTPLRSTLPEPLDGHPLTIGQLVYHPFGGEFGHVNALGRDDSGWTSGVVTLGGDSYYGLSEGVESATYCDEHEAYLRGECPRVHGVAPALPARDVDGQALALNDMVVVRTAEGADRGRRARIVEIEHNGMTHVVVEFRDGARSGRLAPSVVRLVARANRPGAMPRYLTPIEPAPAPVLDSQGFTLDVGDRVKVASADRCPTGEILLLPDPRTPTTGALVVRVLDGPAAGHEVRARRKDLVKQFDAPPAEPAPLLDWERDLLVNDERESHGTGRGNGKLTQLRALAGEEERERRGPLTPLQRRALIAMRDGATTPMTEVFAAAVWAELDARGLIAPEENGTRFELTAYGRAYAQMIKPEPARAPLMDGSRFAVGRFVDNASREATRTTPRPSEAEVREAIESEFLSLPIGATRTPGDAARIAAGIAYRLLG